MRPEVSVRIETIDGGVYEGATLEAALDALRTSAWGLPECKTLKTYMTRVATRCADWNKATVRTDTVEHFVADLSLVGLIRVIRDGVLA
jgi:hypothetical protein